MEVVDVLDHPAVERAADRDVVDHGQVLDELAQPDAAGMGADRDAELGGHQQDRDDLVHARRGGHASIWQIAIASAWNSCLNMTRLWTCSPVATRIGATARAIAAWPRMSSGLVGSSIQYGSNSAQLGHPGDRLVDVPALVGVDRHHRVRADLLADDPRAPAVIRRRPPRP